jgi:hypothetical protein
VGAVRRDDMKFAYQCKAENGAVYRTFADSPDEACRRVADIHQVTVVAVRPSQDPKDAIHVGEPTGS